MTAACVGPLRSDRTVHDSDARYVRLETRYGGKEVYAGREYAHPFRLSEADWETLLRNVSVRPRRTLLGPIGNGATPQAAFRDDERAYLARYLAQALARARRDEIVVFYLSQDLDGHLKEISSGACFAIDTRIRLVLANYRYLASASYLQRPVQEDPLRPAGELLYTFVPGRHQEIPSPAGWGLGAPFRTRTLALSIDYAASLGSRRAGHPSRASAASEDATSQQEESNAQEGLRRLERLREQGLITQEEFSVLRERSLR